LSLHGLLGLMDGHCGELATVGRAAACRNSRWLHRSTRPPESTRWSARAQPRPRRAPAAAPSADVPRLHEQLQAEFDRLVGRPF
jgi:hypothetical protein